MGNGGAESLEKDTQVSRLASILLVIVCVSGCGKQPSQPVPASAKPVTLRDTLALKGALVEARFYDVGRLSWLDPTTLRSSEMSVDAVIVESRADGSRSRGERSLRSRGYHRDCLHRYR